MDPSSLLTQFYNTPEIQQAQSAANSAQQNATDYASAASLLPQKLREAIQSKLDYNKDIIDQKSKAMSEYFAAPATARSQYQDIWNPFDREKLVSQEVANKLGNYQGLVDILGERRGAINDIVGAGTGAFQSGVTAAQGAADRARQAYSDKLALADKLASATQWGYEQTHKGSGGGGLDTSGLAQLLALMGYGGGGTGGTVNHNAFVADIPTNNPNDISSYKLDFSKVPGVGTTQVPSAKLAPAKPAPSSPSINYKYDPKKIGKTKYTLPLNF